MSYKNELVFAKRLAVQAGEIMQQHFRQKDTLPTWKAENDAVSIADTTINDMVIESIKSQYPNHGVIGEEASYEPQRSESWIVDPIDGTLPYLIGLPISAFLLAHLVNGRPKLALAYNPWMNVTYSAIEGEGAYCNDKQITIPEEPINKFVELILWAGSPHKARMIGIRERLEENGLSPQNFAGGISRLGIADGRMLGAIYSDKSPWDMAVIDLMVTEAGGKVTDLDGNQLDYRGDIMGGIAGSLKTHAQLLELVNA